MRKHALPLILSVVLSATLLTACQQKKYNDALELMDESKYEEAANTSVDDDICDGYYAPLQKTEEFDEIFDKISGTWMTEDGRAFIEISENDGLYNFLSYASKDMPFVSSIGADIYSIKYDTGNDGIAENGEICISIYCNYDPMQWSTDIYFNENEEYIKTYHGKDNGCVYYYRYDDNSSAYQAVNSANLATELMNYVSGYSEEFDYDKLVKTCEVLYENKIVNFYQRYMDISQVDDDKLELDCLVRVNNSGVSTEDVNIILIIKTDGSLVSFMFE